MLLGLPREGSTGPVGRGMGRCSGFAFAQITTGDLDIAVVGQLLTANLPLGDQFEAGTVEMVGFEAAFGRGGLWKQGLEHAPGNPHHAFIVAYPDAESTALRSGFHRASGGKRKNMNPWDVLLMFTPTCHGRIAVSSFFVVAATARFSGKNLTDDT